MSSATTEPVDQAIAASPPVVAVVVVHEPGPWWEQALRSLAAQTYQSLTILVLVTPSSPADVERRLQAVLPQAVARRLPANVGFGPACNEVLTAVEGASFFLFCHDDVAFDTGAVTHLVEEAVRSNAGVVGPKVVDWDDPRRLLQVGMSADKFGAPSPNVDRHELDQEQHDAVRDCFYVPGAATLVRADLFTTLGGFDPGIDLVGEDLDLCWRAHVAGARVLVAPAARVAHRQGLEARADAGGAPYDRRRLGRRHRLRSVLTCYGRLHRWRVLPQLLVLTVVEAVAALVVGHADLATDVASAWPGVFGRRRGLRGLRRQRRAVRSARVVGDGEVRALQVRGSAGANRFLRGQLDGDDRHTTVAGVLHNLAQRSRSGNARLTLRALAAVAFVVLVGSRDLLLQPIPAVGQFVPFDRGAVDLLRAWASGYDPTGLGGLAPNPTALGFLGFAGFASLGAMGQLRRILIVGLLPVGATGVWRLTRPVGTIRTRIVGLVVYAALPVAANSLAGGRWGGLVVWAVAPWIVDQLVRASGAEPFAGALGAAGGRAAGDERSPFLHRTVAVALFTALAAMVEPFAFVLTLLMGLALSAGALVAGSSLAAGRLLRVAAGGAAVAFVLHIPWSVGLVTGGWVDTSGTGATVLPDLGVARIVRFASGPTADSPLVWALLAAAALPLFIGRAWRLFWAVPCWTLAVTGMALVWLGGRGWLSGLLPAPEVLLAPAAVGIALSAALAVAVVEADLPAYRVGWHQFVAAFAAAALAVGVLPMVVAARDGRWGLPRGDFRQIVAGLESPSENFRTLWIGDTSALPLRGWRLDAPSLSENAPGHELVYATTMGRSPDIENLWSGSREGSTEMLTRTLEDAAAGSTHRLGAQLATLGVEYVIVPRRPAPVPYVDRDTSQPDALVELLASQLDLQRVEVVGGIHVFRNIEWGPSPALLAPSAELPAGAVAGATVPGLEGARDALPDRGTDRSAEGELTGAGQLWVANGGGDAWELRVGGAEAERRDAFGWASVFTVDRAGAARLHLNTPWVDRVLRLTQVALWLAACLVLWRSRVRRERAPESEQAG